MVNNSSVMFGLLLAALLGKIEEYRKGSSPLGCLSVSPCTFLHDSWMDFIHIGYHVQVPWAADVYVKYNLALCQI